MNSLRHARAVLDPYVEEAAEPQQLFSISLLARIHAVPVRLMHAWSVPDYMDAWLTPPHGEGVRLRAGKSSEAGFSIDFTQWGRSVRSVIGQFANVNISGVRIAWELCTATGSSITSLKIEFKPRGTETLVLLRHDGFRDPDESIWHQALWQSSMARMQFLIR
jgi:hypothetical protein